MDRFSSQPIITIITSHPIINPIRHFGEFPNLLSKTTISQSPLFYHVPTLGHGNSPFYPLDKPICPRPLTEVGMTRSTDTIPNVFAGNVSNQMMMAKCFLLSLDPFYMHVFDLLWRGHAVTLLIVNAKLQ